MVNEGDTLLKESGPFYFFLQLIGTIAKPYNNILFKKIESIFFRTALV